MDKNNIIDNIIDEHTKLDKYGFTGGYIQYVAPKYKDEISTRLVLFFGYDKNRNSIKREFEIETKDAAKFLKALKLKTQDVLDNNKKSSATKRLLYDNVRGACKDSRYKGNKIATSDDVTSVGVDVVDDDFALGVIYAHKEQLEAYKTETGNSRRNSGTKNEWIDRFKDKATKYGKYTVAIVLRDDCTGKAPKYIMGLLGRGFPNELAKKLSKQSESVLIEALDANDKDFAEFISAVREV